MKYRVIQMPDGRYKCQWRSFLFWWVDSHHPPTRSKEEQESYARFAEQRD